MGQPLHEFDAGLRRRLGCDDLIGVDEAGRGPLAGPVVVAAVRLGPGGHKTLRGVRDSKQLTAPEREALFEPIKRAAKSVALSWAHPREIERVNILAATLAAMRRAVQRLEAGGFVIVDGNCLIPALDRPQLAVVDADALSLAAGCASVIAKLFRDRWMSRLDRRFPGYGLARHKGYATAEHRDALRRLGPSPVHRRTFACVEELLQKSSDDFCNSSST